MSVKYSLSGNLRTGERYVRISWFLQGASVRKTFGLKVYCDHFDAETEHVSGGKVNEEGLSAKYVNTLLHEIKKRCLEYEDTVAHIEADISNDDIFSRLDDIIESARGDVDVVNLANGHRLIPTFLQFIEKAKVERVWSKATETSYRKLIPYFEKYFSRSLVEDIGLSWMERLYEKLSQRLTERTIINMMVNTRSFIRWVVREYGCGEEALRFVYKARPNVSDITYLTADELRGLKELIIPEDGGQWEIKTKDGVRHVHRSRERLETVRDMFLFCCMTGLRYSDMQRLEWSHVYRDSIRLHTTKTMKPVEISLNPATRLVLDKMFAKDGDDSKYVFPRISNSDYNRDLKIIGKLLDLQGTIFRLKYRRGHKEEDVVDRHSALTTHAGRHTFVVQALSSGITGNVVISWTGHSGYESLKPYIGLTSEAKRKAMTGFESWLEDVYRP